ncbi:ubiquinol oxidase subunit II [Rhizobium sp. LEGMi198b]|uniref:ubiquinol oxidase subunit II n=1 Tax=unclassified Rhizobium TaxID=2613769 RepID=UPI000CDF458E|nr:MULTISPECIES: ubiquinol oxidase subunit II [Rhizobium]AVA19851.1 cytochrome o ubiquinol oxidase subunit 2 [Rhizobium sp. NXC24]UWU21169.1 ubiquinol oxidase subunit II [Rhizobium tropici]
MPRLSKIFSRLSVLPLILLLSGCNMVVMAPSGDIAVQQRDLIVVSTVLMLLIIIPVIFLTLFFAWKYRQSNTTAPYNPDWHHSTRLELVIWSAPLAIIIALGAVTWISTHQLDPYRPLDRVAAGKPVTTTTRPLNVEVVALDWKWLFFYPDLGIATVNEMAAPVDAPINFKITASSVMNSFFIPALAGQIYAMPGMETKLHAVINKPGEYQGLSANYSGAGFSHMRFKFHGLSQADFDQWVQKVKSQGSTLGRPEYLTLAKPSEREPVRYYNSVDDGLYDAILNMCADPSKMCMGEMMHIDAKGGAGKDSQENRERLIYDNRGADAGEVTPVKADGSAGHTMQQGDNSMQGMGSMQGMDMGNGSSSDSSTGSAQHQGH